MRFKILILLVALICSSCVFAPSRKEFANVYFNLGNAYMRLGESENAAKAFLKAAEYDKKFGASTFNLAKSYILAERYGNALEVLDGLARSDSSNGTIRSAQAYCYYKLGNMDKAFELYGAILEREPDNYIAMFNYASILAEEKKIEEAMEIFHKIEIMQDAESDSQLYHEMAKIAYRTGDYANAMLYGEKALELDDDNIDINKFLLMVYEDGKYYAKYLELADKVIEHNDEKSGDVKNPENAELYFKKCDIMFNHTGDFIRGLAQLKKALGAGYSDKGELYRIYENKELLNSDEICEVIDKSDILKGYVPPKSE